MGLLALPVEIRLKIYSELLVSRRPIVVMVTALGRLFSPEGGLCPALLRASKQVYGEAVAILYSENCFRWPGLGRPSTGRRSAMSLFSQQVGPRTGLLRHVIADFPTAPLETAGGRLRLLEVPASREADGPGFPEEQLEPLILLRDACPGIETLELVFLMWKIGFDSRLLPKLVDRLLDLIQTRLDAFPTLRNVTVHVELPRDEQDDPGAGAASRETRTECLNLLYSRGWDVKTTTSDTGPVTITAGTRSRARRKTVMSIFGNWRRG